jgi:hypothetical protein
MDRELPAWLVEFWDMISEANGRRNDAECEAELYGEVIFNEEVLDYAFDTALLITKAWREPETPPGPIIEAALKQLATEQVKHMTGALRAKTRAQERNLKYRKEGKKLGWAAAKNSWLDYWDDAWAERRENDKGWKVGNKEIIASLPEGVVHPNPSTIHRRRQKRYKELNS